MRYKRKFLAGTLILIHLITLLFVPYLHVHPNEDHGHIQGKIGHVHVSPLMQETGHDEDMPSVVSSYNVLDSELPELMLLSGTVWLYRTVSHFRWHIPIYLVVSALFPQFYRLPPVTSAIFDFPDIDVFFFLLLSHTIFLASDLPPPVA